ncbi:hypothetical protein KTD55_30270, partial [Burkholderia gladioli]|uniref:hypothetical protein n=1 Tax=Burkholderia gladioli TaxID=28095 RepID=UPI001C24DD28
GLFQNPDDLAFRESGRLHAKFPVDPAARKFYLEHPLILGGTTEGVSSCRDCRNANSHRCCSSCDSYSDDRGIQPRRISCNGRCLPSAALLDWECDLRNLPWVIPPSVD